VFPSAAPGSPGAAPAAVPVVLTGHGLGHGIGLSQWGAEERAAAGAPLPQILAFYYPGTSIGSDGAAARQPLRVLVAQAPALQIGARGSFAVRDAAGHTWRQSGLQSALPATFGGQRVRYPVLVQPVSQPLRVGGVPYAGTVRIFRKRGALLAVNVVPVEQYVRGVVAAECPAFWPAAALKAQAVAARSYALANRRPRSVFDLYSDDRSQNYRGLARNYETSASAVEATAGQVLWFRGKIANAMFTASNGGLTRAGHEPYLVARPDAFDARSPAADWGPVTITSDQLEAAFPKLRAPAATVAFTYGTSGRVRLVRITTTRGDVVRESGFVFQERLGLRSTFFTTQPASALG
jgi:SpoIID/LytB domain protein